MAGAGEMAVAGEWQALENGSCWRMASAGEWQALENGEHDGGEKEASPEPKVGPRSGHVTL